MHAHDYLHFNMLIECDKYCILISLLICPRDNCCRVSTERQ